jgi:hypothetical protein
MRSRTATGLLGNAKRYLPVAFATMLAAGAQLSTDVIADVFRLQPTLILQQIFTDNIRASSSDRDADGITSLTARLNAALTTDHIEAAARVEATYNEVWAANDLDGFAGRGDAVTRVRLYENILEVDGVARRQQVFLQPSGSGIDFLTGIGQRQETDYAVSPLLNLEVLGLADLAVRATYAQVLFDDPVAGPSPIPLDDITLKEISGRIGTGQRASAYELIASADYLETDTDFQRRNIVGSVFLNLTDKFTAIGRVGYERITDPSIGKRPAVERRRTAQFGQEFFSSGRIWSPVWLFEFDQQPRRRNLACRLRRRGNAEAEHVRQLHRHLRAGSTDVLSKPRRDF